MTRVFFVLVSAALSIAGVAHAAISPVHTPFKTAPCVSPIEAAADMSDPNGYYAAGGASCPALCKKAGADCKQYVRLALACMDSYWADAISYEKKGCGIVHADDPAARNQCKGIADTFLKQSRLEEQNERDQGLAACEDWEGTCEATCGNP